MLRPKVADALSYLDLVKARFSNQPDTYTEFLDVMREFKAQTIGTDIVIRRVRELFDGHTDLIDGFNTFIPQGYRTEGPNSLRTPHGQTSSIISTIAPSSFSPEVISPSKLPSFAAFRHADGFGEASGSSTLSFVGSGTDITRGTVYTTSCLGNSGVPSQPPLLRSHLTSSTSDSHSIHSISMNAASSNQTLNAVTLMENQDVLRGPLQSHVFPPTYVSNVQHQAQSFNHAINYVNKIKNRFLANLDVYRSFLEILQWYQREQEHADVTRRKKAELQVYQDMAKLLHGHEDLLQEFSRFLPESTSVTSDISDVSGPKLAPYCSVSELSSAVHLGSTHNRFPASSTSQSGDPHWHRSMDVSPGITTSGAPVLTPISVESKKLKRTAPSSSHTTAADSSVLVKKMRQSAKDVSIADTAHILNGNDAALLQKIRDALDVDASGGSKSYLSLIQNITLFNRSAISESQLIDNAKTLLQRHPDLWRQFRDILKSAPLDLGGHDSNLVSSNDSVAYRVRTPDCDVDDDKRSSISTFQHSGQGNSISSPPLYDAANTHPLAGPDNAAMIALVSEVSQRRLDLDFNELRTCGASYRALPTNFPQPKCSGRAKSAIARSVLNDSYISFSSLTSEDSQFVSSKKNQYEENMYHTEDERYEADMIMEVNRAALQNLIVVKRRIDRMSRDELQSFHLDDLLGGTSAILMKKAIHRVYGDKAGDVIYGLKTCPSTVVPIVIQRMRQKDSEWREAVRTFHRFWSDQDSKNYLRSLDHQGASFKQRDTPFLRAKTVINQIEAIARGEKSRSSESSSSDPIGCMISKCLTSCSSAQDALSPGSLGSALSHVVEGVGHEGGVHLTLEYPPLQICASLLDDAASLIIHHVKRQSNTNKEDKRMMKLLVRTVLQDLFMQERFPMSDDEDEEDGVGSEDSDDGNEDDEADKEETNVDETVSNSGGNAGRRSRRAATRSVVANGKQSSKTQLNAPHLADIEPDSQAGRSSKSGLKVKSSVADSSGETEIIGVKNRLGFNLGSHLPAEEYYCLLYGNNHWYAFLRLHHLLLTRLSQLRSRALTLQREHILENGKSHAQVAEVLRLRKVGNVEPKEHYGKALNHVKDLLDGCEDTQTYEDRLRDMFGIYAYPWFTMDRLISNLVRQLHMLASSDELSRRLTNLFRGNFRTPTSRATASCKRQDANCTLESQGEFFVPFFNGVCGPLKTRFLRLKNEAVFRHSVFSACLDVAASSSGAENNGSIFTNDGSLDRSTSIPNCYAFVMLRHSSKLLVRLLEPSGVLNSISENMTARCYSPVHLHSPCPQSVEETRTAMALKRAVEEPMAEARHWFDYLARYLLVPGCWTEEPVSPSLCARIRPVFLYRNVRQCVNRLTHIAVRRRQQEIIATGDPQPEELIVHTLSEINPQNRNRSPSLSYVDKTVEQVPKVASSKGNLETDIWELMVGVFRNNLTHTELFRDTFSSECMHSSTNILVRSASKTYKINWSVGSYGIFVRRKEKKPSCRERSIAKFHEFQSEWLDKHSDPEQSAQIESQFHPERACLAVSPTDFPKPESHDTKTVTMTELSPEVSNEKQGLCADDLNEEMVIVDDMKPELTIVADPAPVQNEIVVNSTDNKLVFTAEPIELKSESFDNRS